MLHEVFVVVRGGERPAGHQVVLVRSEDHPPADRGKERLLPAFDQIDDCVRLFVRVQTKPGFLVELRDAERDGMQRRQFGVLVEHAAEGVVEHRPVVHARADHELPVDLDPVVE